MTHRSCGGKEIHPRLTTLFNPSMLYLEKGQGKTKERLFPNTMLAPICPIVDKVLISQSWGEQDLTQSPQI